jgi:hypothetical protein
MSVGKKITIGYINLFILPALASILLFIAAFGQFTLGQERLSKTQQKEIVDSLCSKLEKLYPFPETGKKTGSFILKNYEEGKYSQYTLPSEFVQHLNDDLETSSKDGHLGIIHSPAMASELSKEKNTGEKVKSYADLTAESERWNNYGFKELKILDGNIGYLDLRTFFSTKYAGETAVAAMNYFSNCNALIIDLRRNGGGWDDMVTFLASYFIKNTDDIIFSITHSTLDDSYFASVPDIYVPGKKLTDIPVYILTSKSTASAAEAFTNIMRHFSKKTTIIGETTAGAENPVEHVILFGDYILRIPTWQKIYSYDKTGWEETGIKPDIKVRADSALNIAHLKLLHKLKDEAADETVKNKYQWYIDGVNALNNPFSVPADIMRSYSGKYGNRNIYYENNNLYYQYKNRAKRKMFAISNDYFLIEGYDFFRVKFIKDNDRVTGLNEIYDDGSISELSKE